MNTVEVLKAARRKIERGWTQGAEHAVLGEGVEAYCASGAIRSQQAHVTGLSFRGCPQCSAVFCLRRAIGGGSIERWNDMEDRTAEEVLAAYDKAIALAEADSQPAAAPQK